MALTLYRKYRPKVFDELVGQNHIRVTLRHEIENGQLAHAYLFTGPRGVGKTTVARLVARAVNCLDRQGADPDNRCAACREILEGRALDVIEIDAASQTGVENVRENIIANARVAPSRWTFKVFIIDEVHMLSIGAFNALLKLLEEPPDHTLFILASTEVHKLPETIISRCQRFDFHRVTIDDLKRRLKTVSQAEGVNVEEAVLDELARRAEGSVRDVDSLLGQLIALGEKTITPDLAAIVLPRTDVQSLLAFFQCFVRQDRAAAVASLHQLIDEGVSLPTFLHQFVELVRALMLLKVNPTLERSVLTALDTTQERELMAVVAAKSLADLVRLLTVFRDLERQVKVDPFPQLPVELAILEAIPAAEPTASAPPQLSSATTAKSPGRKKRKSAAKVQTPASEAIDQPTIQAAWPKVIEAAKRVNPGVALLLKSAAPVGVDGHQLVIGVRFPFHAERLLEAKNRRGLETALEEVFGAPLSFRCTVVPQVSRDDETVVGDIAKTLGGEVL